MGWPKDRKRIKKDELKILPFEESFFRPFFYPFSIRFSIRLLSGFLSVCYPVFYPFAIRLLSILLLSYCNPSFFYPDFYPFAIRFSIRLLSILLLFYCSSSFTYPIQVFLALVVTFFSSSFVVCSPLKMRLFSRILIAITVIENQPIFSQKLVKSKDKHLWRVLECQL